MLMHGLEGIQPARWEVIGYDLESKKFLARPYDDQGSSEVFEVALKGKSWSIIGDTVRFNGKFDAKGSKFTGLWEVKEKKAGWQPWIELKLVRD
jgi:hypothetical protein